MRLCFSLAQAFYAWGLVAIILIFHSAPYGAEWKKGKDCRFLTTGINAWAREKCSSMQCQ
jgi:hypothetical protein